MNNKILVTYASRAGSTAGVAEAIGQTFVEKGMQVDVLAMQEVKDLAAQTGKATENIAHQISTIEETTARATDAMKTISTTIAHLDEIANTVAGTVDQQGLVMQEIAESANSVAQGTREVAANVSQGSKAATEIDQIAGSVSTAAGELSLRSDMLAKAVDQFLAKVRAA